MSAASDAPDGFWRDTDVDHRQTIVAILCVSVLGACGAPNQGLVKFRDPKIETHQNRHQRAVRLAARGRVLYRSGLDSEASETLRKSYGLEPDLHVLLDHANAAERANWFEHAYTAWTKVLDHPVDAELRKRAQQEAQRLKGLIPTHHASVLVHISPPEATMLFRSDNEQRVIMSDGVIRLPPGDWHVVSSASGFSQELRIIRVREGRD
ncbi:MAG TPA: hypothetical protein DCQ06_05740, partial [Myxococcales bacterium]|nr:hypothetical protein [Myxococcales bacterium]